MTAKWPKWSEEAAMRLLNHFADENPEYIEAAKHAMKANPGLSLADAFAGLCLAAGQVEVCDTCGQFHTKRNKPMDH